MVLYLMEQTITFAERLDILALHVGATNDLSADDLDVAIRNTAGNQSIEYFGKVADSIRATLKNEYVHSAMRERAQDLLRMYYSSMKAKIPAASDSDDPDYVPDSESESPDLSEDDDDLTDVLLALALEDSMADDMQVNPEEYSSVFAGGKDVSSDDEDRDVPRKNLRRSGNFDVTESRDECSTM